MKAKPTCFVVMPMSDIGGTGYEPGHWDRVYSELLSRACDAAGFEPVRADSAKRTSIIMVDVLRQLYNADMVLCDLSGLRANVFFELGLRQAFNKPVVITHDELLTERPFDTAQLRDWQYRSSLRVDLVREDVETISKALRETADGQNQSSLVQLLSIDPAKLHGAKEGEVAQYQNLLQMLEYMASKLDNRFAFMENQLQSLRLSQATQVFPPTNQALFAGGLLGGGSPRVLIDPATVKPPLS